MTLRNPPRGRSRRDAFPCPNCGADVPAGSAACPACGSDEETGWSEGADAWGADIPTGYGHDDDFDYEEFVEEEFAGAGRKADRPRTILIVFLALAGLAILIGLALIVRRP
jgi:hypothetical protein